ncbi:MAG: Heme exporter protein C [Burkholderia sp.]|jgi:heme exporter protein C
MNLSDPQTFYRTAGKVIPWLMGAALLLFAVGFYMAFFVCPIDARQGNSYRILFIHVSAAWLSMTLYVLMAVCSLVGLIRNSRISFMLAQAMAPTGALMAFLTLFCGAFWGRPTWGAYWVWDARLTSELILFFLYLGFIALHNAIDDKARADRAASVISIVGVINVPIIYFSVRWWNTLHQGASISVKGASLAPIMLYTLLVMLCAGTCYGAGAVLARMRSIILERDRREEWALRAALEGKL